MSNIKKQTARKQIIEELYTLKFEKPMTIHDILKFMYCDKRMTQKEIAKELRVSVGSVNNWLNESNIPARKMYFL